MQLAYSAIEEQLTAFLPEIRPAAERYWKVEGTPGKDSGPYIFFEGVVACYVGVLLAMPRSNGRDELLRRAFAFVEEMFCSADREVGNLAFIGLFEGRSAWWFKQASEFIGPCAVGELDRFSPGWRNAQPIVSGDDGLIDLYNVRGAIASRLKGVEIGDIPGKTYIDP